MNRFCWFLLCCTLWPANARSAELDARGVAFYYPWYGNPATDGRFANWNHPVAVRGEAPRSFPGGDDIGSNFYPSLGCYSVNNPDLLRELDYQPLAPDYYPDRTAHWLHQLKVP